MRLLSSYSKRALKPLNGRVDKPVTRASDTSTRAWNSTFARRTRIRIVPPERSLPLPFANRRRQPRPGLAAALQQTVDKEHLPEDYQEYFEHIGEASQECGCPFCIAQRESEPLPQEEQTAMPTLVLNHNLAVLDAAMEEAEEPDSAPALAVSLDPDAAAHAAGLAAAAHVSLQQPPPLIPGSSFQPVLDLQAGTGFQPVSELVQPGLFAADGQVVLQPPSQEQQQQLPQEAQQYTAPLPLLNLLGGQFAQQGDGEGEGDELGDLEGEGDEWEDADAGGGVEEEQF